MKANTTLGIIAVISIIASCKPTLYFPDRVNSPGFTGRYQGSVTASIKPQTYPSSDEVPSGNTVSASVDMAFSLTDHLAITGSYRGLNDRSVKESTSTSRMGGVFNGRRTEIALGYFQGGNDSPIFEVFGGYGNGTIDRKGKTTPQNNFKADYNTYFVQTAIGGSWDFFRVTAGGKFAVNHYYRILSPNPQLRYQIGYNDDAEDHDLTKKGYCFLTPYMNMEAGYKFIMFNVQTGISTQIGGHRIYGSPFYATFGLTFRLEPSMFKEQKTKTNHEQ